MGLISLVVGGIMDANRMVKENKAQNDDTTQHVVVGNKFAIDVPSFLSPRDTTDSDASVSYYSRTLDVSFMVIDEPKEELIESINELGNEVPDLFSGNKSLLDKMATLVLSNMFELSEIEIGGYKQLKINGLNALTLNIFKERTFLKDAVYGSFAFIEGKDTMYQINILSGGTSIQKLADKMEKSFMSFVEL